MQTRETKIKHFISRHSIKVNDSHEGESRGYPGITEAGVDLAREIALNFFLPRFIQSPPGTIICFGGITSEIRTLSTNRVYYDSLKEWLLERKTEGIDFIDKDRMKEKYSPREILININSYPQTKFVVSGLLKPREFSTEIWKKADVELLNSLKNGDERTFMNYWLSRAEKDKEFHPTPSEDAVRFYQGLLRIENFVKKYLPERNFVIVTVAHTFELNSFIGWATSPDNIRKGYEQTTERNPFKPAEVMILNKTENILTFRGKPFQLHLAA